MSFYPSPPSSPSPLPHTLNGKRKREKKSRCSYPPPPLPIRHAFPTKIGCVSALGVLAPGDLVTRGALQGLGAFGILFFEVLLPNEALRALLKFLELSEFLELLELL